MYMPLIVSYFLIIKAYILFFTRCVNSIFSSENKDSKPKRLSTKKSRNSRRQKRGKGLEEWMLDLKGSVLEPLGDFE